VLKKVSGGFVAASKAGKPLSKKPKTKKAAIKQIVAVEASQARRAGKPMGLLDL
jgi:hypothetical protein